MKKIIFVDDDECILDIAGLIFEKAGYQLIAFSNGEPIVQGDFGLPDLFILDKRLPIWDGLELCRILKADDRTKDIPIIILSADTNIQTLARPAGADGIIEKPFDVQQLLNTVKQFVS